MRTCYRAFLICATIAVVSASQAWTGAGGNQQNTGFSPSAITADGYKLWGFTSELAVSGSAAVSAAGDQVYFVTGSMLYCMTVSQTSSFGQAFGDIFTGGQTITWSFPLGALTTVSPSLSPDGTVVYIGTSDNKMWSISASTGKKVWGVELDSAIVSPAASTADFVLVGVKSGQLYTLNARDGSMAWRCVSEAAVYGAAAINANGTIAYLASAQNNVVAMDIANPPKKCQYANHCHGCSIWSAALSNGQVNVGAVLDEKNMRLYTVSSGQLNVGVVNSIDLTKVVAGANVPGTVNTVVYSSTTAQVLTRASVLDSTHVVFGSEDGTVRAVNVETKAVKWTFSAGQSVGSSPVTDGTVVVFGSTDQNVYGVSAASGTKMWSYGGSAGFDASPAISSTGMVIIADSVSKLYGITAGKYVVGPKILLGVLVAVIASLMLGLCCCWCRRRNRSKPALTTLDVNAASPSAAGYTKVPEV